MPVVTGVAIIILGLIARAECGHIVVTIVATVVPDVPSLLCVAVVTIVVVVMMDVDVHRDPCFRKSRM